MVLRILILFLYATILGPDSLYESHKKKADKLLSKVWEDISFELTPINYPDSLSGELYTAVDGTKKRLGYVLFDEAPSKVDKFSYMIIFDESASIAQVLVLEYRENYGGEIASRRFLKQYIGKQNGAQMEYLQDINGISGATISVQSLNQGVRQNSEEFYQYYIML